MILLNSHPQFLILIPLVALLIYCVIKSDDGSGEPYM